MSVPRIFLNDGHSIPQVGFGVWQVPDDEVAEAVHVALEVGYRHIDTAAIYGNEEGVGRALKVTNVPRDELFVTTKVWNSDQGYDSTRKALDTSLAKLGLDHVDLYLIHWPCPEADRYVDTWKAMLELKESGKALSVGVCNFQPAHLQRLIDETGVAPAINQIELHPYLQQDELRAFNEEHGIVTEDWSPLASGKDVMDDETISEIAEAHDVTPAQVILRWHVQLGDVVLPKSVTPERIRSNLDLFDFELSGEEMAAIAALDRGMRTGPDPDTFNEGAR
ncbi:aldo/keto reductase [Arsenicicoccus piscis]|uniref:Oxidoreductase n=1 Tax=Arsenicicoccus piscis TaxID=673954 RepID=A0ABQ6HQM2_9MICO|nr:aldo/keto reductase [Arsenicicoccus piscis]MCH8629075.1 aldo/keto reductase [Arsenicicoccus piscis]GMA20373.1 oxidoreductase [Arsenicicoccus piscis]